jgi:hypothetical protein
MVVQGFINRICEVNPLINSVVDECYEVALQAARDADVFLASTTLTVEELKVQKPFLGVPFTTKDGTAVKGLFASSLLPNQVVVIKLKGSTLLISVPQIGMVLSWLHQPTISTAYFIRFSLILFQFLSWSPK